jgi:hypothetical protein
MRLHEFILEAESFSNWREPTRQDLGKEYKIEYEIKPSLKSWLDDAWPTLDDFLNAAAQGQVITVPDELDRTIEYRSRTRTRSQLRDLLSSYRSWPEFRNDQTLSDLYTAFEQNREMTMPIVVKYQGDLRVMAGNTRMDVAQQLGITPQVLLISVD